MIKLFTIILGISIILFFSLGKIKLLKRILITVSFLVFTACVFLVILFFSGDPAQEGAITITQEMLNDETEKQNDKSDNKRLKRDENTIAQ